MPSDVDICNLALDRIGHKTITSLDDPDSTSQLCGRNFRQVVEETQMGVPWNGMMTRKSIAADAEAPVWGAAAQHTLPVDCLRVIDVFSGDETRMMDWREEGRKILSNITGNLLIRYQRRSTDPNEWSPALRAAVAARLAQLMTKKLTRSNDNVRLYRQEFEQFFMEAKRANSLNSAPVDLIADRWEQSRYGGGVNG